MQIPRHFRFDWITVVQFLRKYGSLSGTGTLTHVNIKRCSLKDLAPDPAMMNGLVEIVLHIEYFERVRIDDSFFAPFGLDVAMLQERRVRILEGARRDPIATEAWFVTTVNRIFTADSDDEDDD